MICLSNDVHTTTSDKGHWARKYGNCKEPVRVFHSNQSSTLIDYDVDQVFSTLTTSPLTKSRSSC